MAKKSKKSVVWIWRRSDGDYYVGGRMPIWALDWRKNNNWVGGYDRWFGQRLFERLFPFFKMPPKSLGKIVNDSNTLTFEIVETK